MTDRNLRLLFVCTQNQIRSATAESVFSEYEGIDAIGAGTNADSPTPVSGDLIEWADVILVMEEIHRSKITAKYSELLKNKKLAVLDIRDRYFLMQPELIEVLQSRVPKYVGL
jgi:predicted protein tyrosine phosphatase